jgi:hypothetical protein
MRYTHSTIFYDRSTPHDMTESEATATAVRTVILFECHEACSMHKAAFNTIVSRNLSSTAAFLFFPLRFSFRRS